MTAKELRTILENVLYEMVTTNGLSATDRPDLMDVKSLKLMFTIDNKKAIDYLKKTIALLENQAEEDLKVWQMDKFPIGF